MITNFNRKHRNTSFSSLTRMRDNIRSIFTEDNVLIIYISSDRVFHNSYHRFNIQLLIRFHSFHCTFVICTNNHRILLYLSWERYFLNMRFRHNMISSTNFSTSNRNMTNNIFIRCMVLIPLILGNFYVRGKGLKIVGNTLGVNTKLITNITEVISFHKRFNAFIIIVYTLLSSFVILPSFSVLLNMV